MVKKSLLLAVLAGSLLVACDESTSSNNSGGGGQKTSSGTIQAGRDTAVNILAGQTLKFTFVPKAGATYTITTTGKTDTYLEVRDKADKTLEVDDYPSSVNGSIVLVTTTAEPVTILVSGGSSATAGGTIVSVVMTNGPDDFEDDDRLGTARELKPDSVLQSRTITVGDTDWVKIPVVAGRRYMVSVPSSSSYTTYLQAFDKDSTSLTYSTSSLVTVSAPSTGYIFVRVNFNYSTYSGSYSIRAWSDTANMDKYESDDTRALAKNLVVDSAAQPHRLAVGEQDWIKFNVQADSTYRITIVNNANGTLEYDLYTSLTSSSYTNSSTTSSGYTGTLTYVATSTGTAYFNLYGYSSYTSGAYTVSVTKIPNPNGPDAYESDNTLSTAKVLPTDSVLQNRTIHNGDVDWLKIAVTGGTRYRVNLPTAAYTTYTAAYDMDSVSLTTSSGSALSFTAPATGFVYVKVNFYTTTYVGAYTVRAWADTANKDKYEADDTRATAKNIVVDSAAQPHKLSAGEHDWVKFDVEADSTYRITITNSANGTLEYDLYTSLTSSSYTSSSTTSSGYTGTLTYAPTASGTAYFDLYGYLTSTAGAYTISVARIPNPNGPDAYESDNTLSTAKPIVVGALAQSRTIRPADVDWIKVPVDSGRSYRVAPGTSTYTLNLQVFDADSVSMGSSTTGSATFRADTTGFVYVRASYSSTSYTGSYTITVTAMANVVDAYEPDDTKLSAKALPTDGTTQSRHLVADEHDWMKLDLVGGKTYTFTTTNPSTSWSFEGEIQSETSTVTLASVSGSSTLNTSTFTPTTSGIYYLDWHGYSTSSNGEYTIRVVSN